jgi:hypothetical protein
MTGGLIDVMPTVTEGNNPIKIDSVEFAKDWVPFDHFFLETEIGVHDFVEAQDKLQAIENGQISDMTAQDVAMSLYGNDFARARVALLNKQTLFYYNLICNGEFRVVSDTHNDPYYYKVNGYNTITDTTENFLANPISVLMKLRSALIAQGGNGSRILLGDNVTDLFLNSPWVQKTMPMLNFSGFNYEPVKAVNPDSREIQAKGVYDITGFGGVIVSRCSQKVKVNGVTVDAFDPDAIVILDERNLGTLFTRPTVRNVGQGRFIYDGADMSYYVHKEDDKFVSHRSEGFYLPAITKPRNIMKLELEPPVVTP